MTTQRDTLTQAILDLAQRGERDQLEALALALSQAARLCRSIADSTDPAHEAESALVLSSGYGARRVVRA